MLALLWRISSNVMDLGTSVGLGSPEMLQASKRDSCSCSTTYNAREHIRPLDGLEEASKLLSPAFLRLSLNPFQ